MKPPGLSGRVTEHGPRWPTSAAAAARRVWGLGFGGFQGYSPATATATTTAVATATATAATVPRTKTTTL